MRKYAAQIYENAGITVTPKSLEENVKAVVTKVTLGEADAGIVYATDVTAAGADAEGVEIPDDINVVAEYPIAALAEAPNATAHRRSSTSCSASRSGPRLVRLSRPVATPGSQHPTTVRCDDGGVGRSGEQLLLGEWASLGILYPAPSHGFAIAARLKPDGDVGRVWSLSRALTYRSLDQLVVRGFIPSCRRGAGHRRRQPHDPRRHARGGPSSASGSHTPVTHLRDLRSELLLKLVIAETCEIDVWRDAGSSSATTSNNWPLR